MKEYLVVAALHTPPEISSVSLVMSRKRNVGAVMILHPLEGTMTTQHTEHEGFTAHTWTVGTDIISYIYPAPSVKQAIESAWSHGAYDIRIIVDAPKDLRSSGSIVSFAGRPAVTLEKMSMDSPVIIDWGHIAKVQEEVNWLIAACSLDGHYQISWRPNYGTNKILVSRRSRSNVDPDGRRTSTLPIMPELYIQLTRAEKMAPADIVITFSPTPKVRRVEGITWMESSRPRGVEENL